MTVDRAALVEHGYTTTPLLDPADIARLWDLWADLGVPPDDPYFTTNIHTDRATARAVDLAMKAIMGPPAERALPGFVPFLAAFIFKGTQGGEVGLHPDWTYTDERRHRTYLYWCPLVDTDEGNGTLRVVPGSHRLVTGLRGSGDFASVTAGVEELLLERSVSVPLRVGEAIVYDAAVIHGSPPNQSLVPRPAAAMAVAPAGAQLVHFHRAPDGPTSGYEIDESWYTVAPFAEAPAGYPSVEPWTAPITPLRTEQVLAAP